MGNSIKENLEKLDKLLEELQLHRRNFNDRMARKIREKVLKPVRDLLPARRERQQRDRRHRLNIVSKNNSEKLEMPGKRLSTVWRYR